MDEKPRDFAGVSAFVVDPPAVAELGIGKAEGSNRSLTTTDKVCGAPSYISAISQTRKRTSAMASICTLPPILPTLNLNVKELCSCLYSNE